MPHFHESPQIVLPLSGKVCLYCRVNPTTYAQGQYCSIRCAARARWSGREERPCEQCGKPVPRRRQKYCSIACRGAARQIPLEVRFWANVQIGPDCWLWVGWRNRRGYGALTVGWRDKTTVLAHRLSWELNVGPIPDGMGILHKCPGGGNPACVNPAHLCPGTQLENADDRAHDGREPCREGGANGRARLTEADVLELRRRYAAGKLCFKDEGRLRGISATSIAYAVKGRTWSHLPGITPPHRRSCP